MKKSLRLFGTFEKVEAQSDGTVKVFGYASSEAVDSQGEVVKADAMRAAMPEYLKFGAVREMHKADAAGTAIEMEVKDDGRTWFGAHVVDPIAVKKVETNVYKGFSIGGKVTERDSADSKIITGLNLTEISLVDRPANPEATFSLFKADGIDADEPDPAEKSAEGEVGQAVTDAPAAPPAAKAEAESAAPPAPASTDKAATASLKKDMYDVGRLAELCTSVMWLHESAAYEASREGDNSAVPSKIMSACQLLCEALKEMAVEEVDEMLAVMDGTGAMAMAASAAGLKKKGARNSKADQSKIQTVHDHSVDLGAMCSSEKAAASGDLKKLADVESDLAKMTGERDELQKKYDELAAKPAPAKGSLKAVEKADDVTAIEKTEAKDLDPSHPDYALSLVKKAHSNPQLRKL